MLGFTKTERIIIILLALSVLIGSGINLYKSSFSNSELSLKEKQELKVFEKEIAIIISKDTVENTKSLYKNDKQTAYIDINSATKEELEKLPTIGPVIAQRIIDYRKQRGRFDNLDELINVRGIGYKTLSKIKPHIKTFNYNLKQ